MVFFTIFEIIKKPIAEKFKQGLYKKVFFWYKSRKNSSNIKR